MGILDYEFLRVLLEQLLVETPLTEFQVQLGHLLL